MSLSDKVQQSFEKTDFSVLENLDKEYLKGDAGSKQEWGEFKVFYQDLKTGQKEADLFKGLFDLQEQKEPVFDQLGREAEQEDKGLKQDKDDNTDGDVSGKADDTSIEVTDREQGAEKDESLDEPPEPAFEQGYEQGLEQGRKEGYEKGFEKGRKEGHEQGLKSGYSEGYEKGEKEAEKDIELIISEKSEQFKELLLKLDNTYHDLAARSEEMIISLICSIAEKVVLAKVEIDDGLVKETVLDAVNTLPEPEDIILTVSGDDYEYMEMVKEDLFEFIKSLKTVSVKSDSSVKRGGCRVETKDGRVEVDIQEKLERIFLSIKGKTI